MLEKLFKYPTVLSRHKNAPFFQERNRYLIHRNKEGCAHETLLRIARELFRVVQVLSIPTTSSVAPEHIKTAANRWARRQYRRGYARTLKWSREFFIQVATDWLRFLGRLHEPVVELPKFAGLIEDFTIWMESERGLSLMTTRNYCWHVKKFLRWCENHNRSVFTVQIMDIDTFLATCGDEGWTRASVAKIANVLKTFFRYAGQRGWCPPTISFGIQGPRLFSQESLPSGPTWGDVNSLISSLETNRPHDIRDRAIVMLFALYALRSSEVAKLRLDDIDWEKNLISVFRPKQRKIQIYPLLPIVGNAIISYLRNVRQQNYCREIFLTLKAPVKPISAGGLYNIVSRRMKNIGLHTHPRGPHALRHACATHLVSKGLSLKEIGDHLGHRSTSATRIYAKVDLPGLRQVADFDLGGLS
ncbi:MAG: tyrosine-type recombinase/integrase [Pseudomonadota bacterium]